MRGEREDEGEEKERKRREREECERVEKERVGLSWPMLNEWPDCTDAVRICINRFDQ